MANAFADKFAAAHCQHNQPETDFDRSDQQNVDDFLDVPANFDHPIEPFTDEAICDALSTVLPFKAPGTDQIFCMLLKQLIAEITDELAIITSCCIELGYWPTVWKTAKVVAIRKRPSPPDYVQSYRPISLLSSINKLLEKMVLKRRTNWCKEAAILPDVQFGFRANLSATHQAASIAHTINTNKQCRRSTGMVSLDVASAFDSVWHSGLLYKLNKHRYDPHLIRVIASWLQNRKFFVQVDSQRSQLRNIDAACPHGSGLSPLLFNIYTSDLNPPDCELFAFADDVALVAEGLQHRKITRRLNAALDYVNKYYDTWHLKLNHTKTAAAIFLLDRKAKRQPPGLLLFAGHNVEFSPVIKYLGVTFDNRLAFKPHIASSRLKVMAATNAFQPMLGRSSKLTILSKRLLIRQIIIPIGIYASVIWAGAHSEHIVYLRRQITRAIKIAYQLPWRTPTTEVYQVANIPLIDDTRMIREHRDKFYTSLT